MRQLTEFESIPEWFVERYNEEIVAWGLNFRKIGPVKTIVLKEGRLSDVSPAEDQGMVLKGARLKAEFVRKPYTGELDKVIVRPASDADESIIARHCEKMQKANWPARLFDKEPTRPGLPVFPTIKPTPFKGGPDDAA